MSFMEKLNETLGEEFNTSITENGAVGYRTTGKELLDINFAVSSLRNYSETDIQKRFASAYFENKLLAIKWLFFASDVRGGMGERRLFRVCINWLAGENPDVVRRVLPLIPEYSRWDNILNLLDTDIYSDVIDIIKNQLETDMDNMKNGKSISLIGKWLPSANASSKQTKESARKVIKGLKITERQYRKMLSSLRRYLDVVETKMSAKEWSAIDYAAVPSRANLVYNNAFLRNDETRRRNFLESLTRGETKINAGTLFPHDVVHKYTGGRYGYYRINPVDTAIEELWKSLPDYVKGAGNTICVADGSGSMTSHIGNTSVSCLDVANALAIYFAERSSGEFRNKYITFSEHPKIVDIGKGNSLRDKICVALSYNEVANTNIEAVFDLILTTAIKNNMTQEDMPQNILILSDMEFDSCATTSHYGSSCRWGNGGIQKKLFNEIADRYSEYGYKLPRLVFWNINSRTETIPIKENKLGVALVSGYSPTIMKMVLSGQTDPFECLIEQLNAERYDIIENLIKDLL